MSDCGDAREVAARREPPGSSLESWSEPHRDAGAHSDWQTRASIGRSCQIDPHAIVGLANSPDSTSAVIGDESIIRAYAIVYAGVRAGSHFQTGHHVLIRGPATIGDHVVIGTGSTVDGNVVIGSYVKIQSHVYVPTHTSIGDRVFIGPNATMTNDKYPLRLRDEYEPEGPILEDDVTVGAGAVLLPGVRIGRGSLVAAGAVVTKAVPAWSLALGNPARSRPIPPRLRGENRAVGW
ncbi:MAG: acetyltransferase [Candidatus Dormibacteraeota bacterium]|nr:acetyltransferase [Candidatus Dormibacteraeota bacterium]